MIHLFFMHPPHSLLFTIKPRQRLAGYSRDLAEKIDGERQMYYCQKVIHIQSHAPDRMTITVHHKKRRPKQKSASANPRATLKPAKFVAPVR